MADARGGLPKELAEDGVHPTDLGFLRMAQAYRPMLAQLLTAEGAAGPSGDDQPVLP